MIVYSMLNLFIGLLYFTIAESAIKRENVILVSYDGFRHDYLDRQLDRLPAYQWLLANGVYLTAGLKNAFVTKTAPNHYTLATGLWEESTGVVGNDFFDPVLNESFRYFSRRNKTDPRMFAGEPIWNTNELKGHKDDNDFVARSGCIGWMGCDVPIGGHLPTHYTSYMTNPWNDRVDQIIKWMTNKTAPINMALLYISEPDLQGHLHGPDSAEVDAVVRQLDGLTGYLLDALNSASLLDTTNVIFTSDHGMTSASDERYVYLDDVLDRGAYVNYGGSPVWNIMPTKEREEEVFEKLRKLDHVTVYRKSDIPLDYHFANNVRVMPIQLYADLGWNIAYNSTTRSHNLGDHGYNNSISSMHPYFVAVGPSFPKGYTSNKQYNNVDLYPIMAHILNVKPAPNNGSLDMLNDMQKFIQKNNESLSTSWRNNKMKTRLFEQSDQPELVVCFERKYGHVMTFLSSRILLAIFLAVLILIGCTISRRTIKSSMHNRAACNARGTTVYAVPNEIKPFTKVRAEMV